MEARPLARQADEEGCPGINFLVSESSESGGEAAEAAPPQPRRVAKAAAGLGLLGLAALATALAPWDGQKRATLAALAPAAVGPELQVLAVSAEAPLIIPGNGTSGEVGQLMVKNSGEDCWKPCQGAGMCPGYCGEGNACCRWGALKDPPECFSVTLSSWGSLAHHTCVKVVNKVDVWHQGSNCWKPCYEKSGYCHSFCGKGNACCRYGATKDPLECQSVTYWPQTSWHTCVAPDLGPPGLPLPSGPTTGPCNNPGEVQDNAGKCVPATGPALMTFYMYKARTDENYRIESTNLASLAGEMWYLHNEVVSACPRKFGYTRIVRYLVTMKNTASLWKGKLHYQFGQYVNFEKGRCMWNNSQCQELWKDQGYVVGCTPLDTSSASLPNYAGPPEAVWYSLPGRCPSQAFANKTQACKQSQLGGECASPDGSTSCTWKAELAGEISIDELSGITDYSAFCSNGGLEYDQVTDSGTGTSFWDGRRDLTKCRQRVARAMQAFQLKYPNYPATLGQPPCDWYR